jgi:signal transduction histidine kinase/ActR/RegA family two-component response regulator
MFITIAAVGTGLSYLLASTLHPNLIADMSSSTYGVCACFFTTINILMQIYNERYVSKAVHTEVARVLEDRIAERTQELQLALTAKKEFLSKVGHEVRTPLHGIIGISQTLYESWKSLAEAERYKMAGVIANSGDRLMGLMNNILDLSKFSAGKIEATFDQDVDITKLIEDAVKTGEVLAQSKGKDIRFDVEIEHSIKRKIECDSTRITQVLINLINNAVNYSDDGEIIVRTSDANGELKLSISDSGVGIPENEKTLIFEAFTQSSLTRDPSKGKGLGLAICAEIIGLHHGQIWAENNNNKPGSTFSFTIPYEQGLVAAKPTKQEIKSLSEQNLSGKILLVDDEELCLRTGSMVLATMGLEVVTANGGIPALEYLRANPNEIDVVLLDLMMPDMYGLNVLEAIKADPKLKHIKVVIQSGLSDAHEMAKASTLGAACLLPKPYSRTSLLNTIQKALAHTEYV